MQPGFELTSLESFLFLCIEGKLIFSLKTDGSRSYVVIGLEKRKSVLYIMDPISVILGLNSPLSSSMRMQQRSHWPNGQGNWSEVSAHRIENAAGGKANDCGVNYRSALARGDSLQIAGVVNGKVDKSTSGSFTLGGNLGSRFQDEGRNNRNVNEPPKEVYSPHGTSSLGGLSECCKMEVQLEEGLSLSLCYLEDLYSSKSSVGRALSPVEMKEWDSIHQADLCVLKKIKDFKASLSMASPKGFQCRAPMPEQRSVSSSPTENSRLMKRSVSRSPRMSHVQSLCKQENAVEEPVSRSPNVTQMQSMYSLEKFLEKSLSRSPNVSNVQSLYKQENSPESISMLTNMSHGQSVYSQKKSLEKSVNVSPEQSLCKQENSLEESVSMSTNMSPEQAVFKLESSPQQMESIRSSLEYLRGVERGQRTRTKSISPKRAIESSPPPEMPFTESSSHRLVDALQLINSAVRKSSTSYEIQVMQHNTVKEIFSMSFSSMSEMMTQYFKLKLTVSPGVHRLQCREVIAYLLNFAEDNNFNNAVYVTANTLGDEKDVGKVKAQRLAECFSGIDVTLNVVDEEYCQSFLQRVAIVGHSYVERFEVPQKPFLISSDNPILRFKVKKFGVANASVDTICQHQIWKDLMDYKPHLIFLLLGGDDITATCEPRVIAGNISSLMKTVEKESGGHCKVIGLESRLKHPNLPAVDFNKIRNAINSKLKSKMFYTSKRYHAMNMSKIELEDGVHLNSEASQRVFWNLMKITREYFRKKLPLDL